MVPTAIGKIVSVSGNGSNKQLQQAIESAVPVANMQTRAIAKQFRGGTEMETCRNIFNFLRYKCKYLKDGYNQNIKLPSAFMRTKSGDCKSYSLFTSAVLNNLGIPNHFVYASYDGSKTPSHIYVETNNGCIVDAVWGRFNSEKKPTYKFKKPTDMNINYISGIGARPIGLTLAERLKGSKVATATKKVMGAVPRQIILGMYSLNVDGIATKSQSRITKIMERWKAAGGDPAAISRAIRDGAGKAPRKVGVIDRLVTMIKGILASKGIKGIGIAEDDLVAKLTDGGTISQKYQAQLVVIGTALGSAVGSAVPAVGTAAGAAAGASIAKVLYEMTPAIVGAIYPTSAANTPPPTPTTTGDDELTPGGGPSENIVIFGKSIKRGYVVAGAAGLAALLFYRQIAKAINKK